MMNKIVVFLTLSTAALAVYSYSSRMELKAIKELKSMEAIQPSNAVYTDFKPPQDPLQDSLQDPLQEPSDVRYGDVLERIEMLRQHLSFQPSHEWINSVMKAAELEIKLQRINQ